MSKLEEVAAALQDRFKKGRWLKEVVPTKLSVGHLSEVFLI